MNEIINEMKSINSILNYEELRKFFDIATFSDNYFLNFESYENNTSHKNTYQMFTMEFKQNCIDLTKVYSIKQVSEMKGVPIKSLSRWILVGAERKKGKYLLYINIFNLYFRWRKKDKRSRNGKATYRLVYIRSKKQKSINIRK